jgi:hypothetical protein
LNGALLIDAEHGSKLRGLHIQRDNVGGFLLELRVVARLLTTQGHHQAAAAYASASCPANNASWPCSRLKPRPVRFEFAGNGDLVDIVGK